MKKYKMKVTVFLCGALGMVLELVAARILSPYVGSSNLIWTTIIGIMLTSMSIGYWLGGKIADKRPDLNLLSLFTLLGAFFTSLIPVLETVLVKPLSETNASLVFVAIVTSAFVFGIPSFILAMVSPFAVKIEELSDEGHNNIGKTSGRISSLSTIGSIVGTFAAGFLLIPYLGVRVLILIVTIVLYLLAFMIYCDKTKKYCALLVLILICLLGINYYGKYIFEKENPDIIVDTDSQYSRIWIKRIETGDASYKAMQVDRGFESYIDQETKQMGATYLYYYDLFDYFNKNAKSTLMIGGAAYTYPTYYLNKYQDKTIDVVEVDKKMTELAQEQFGLDTTNPRLKIYHQDGRSFLNRTDNKYDTILIDAFKGLSAPFELTTYEALTAAKNLLNDNGMVITNIISGLEGKDADFIEYEYATYKAVFPEVKLYQVRDENKEDEQNLILIGFKNEINNTDETKKEQYERFLNREIADFSSDRRIVTDHYSPIGD